MELSERERVLLTDVAAADPYDSIEALRNACVERYLSLATEARQNMLCWLEAGRGNPWIKEATDPPFSILSIEIFSEMRPMIDRVLQGNWCVGQGFAFVDLCLLSQIDGGDEWLCIREEPFESYTAQTLNESLDIARSRFRRFVMDALAATRDERKRLDYAKAAVRRTNDLIRRSAALRRGYANSRVVVTKGVDLLGDLDSTLRLVADHDVFDEDNDPYREHDCASLVIGGEAVIWKLDYSDEDGFWRDPYDKDTIRTLSIMLASEY